MFSLGIGSGWEYDIGIIGFGNMGQALIRFNKILCRKNKILVYDKDTQKTASIPKGINVSAGIKDLVRDVDIVVLAVKPQDMDGVLSELKDNVKDKVIISIAAGITTGYIEKALGEVPVIRAMPNLPARIGQGMIGLCKGQFDRFNYLAVAEDCFYLLGHVIVVEEDKMNAITAVSGSGPAYVCDFLERESSDIYHIPWLKKRRFLREFRAAAEAVGFNKADAGFLVSVTFSGTMAFLKKCGVSPVELKRQVASKGGTTEAALAILAQGGSLTDAVKSALKRAEELSRG